MKSFYEMSGEEKASLSREDFDSIHAEATALFKAVGENDIETVRRMKAEGASLEHRHHEHYNSLLTWAVHEGHAEMVKCLVGLGLAVDGEDAMDNTPLVWAAGSENGEDMTRLLLDLGADVNHVSKKFNMTALRAAAMCAQADVVKFLIGLGADQAIKAFDGKTAEDMATEERHAGVRAVFEEYRREKRAASVSHLRRQAQKRGLGGLKPS